MRKLRIAIITFHAANNYGAVIQAYALQRFFLTKKLECEIIDFRSYLQVDFNALYSKRNGLKSIIKNAILSPYHKKRRVRVSKFDLFKTNRLMLTKDTYFNANDLETISDTFDYYISGSDQVWNVNKKADVNLAYFLNFVKDDSKKIGYAISLGSAGITELEPYSEWIRKFSAVSVRETNAKEILHDIRDDVFAVLDPTLLVEREVLEEIANSKLDIEPNSYIFYYSLDGFDKRDRNMKELKILSGRLNKKVIMITPEWPVKRKGFKSIVSAGPEDFLFLIKNAYLVCTNSFHGTALSIAFGKNFYVLEKYDETDFRKLSILNQLSLESRMIWSIDNVSNMVLEDIDYDNVYLKLRELRNKSEFFLESNIGW